MKELHSIIQQDLRHCLISGRTDVDIHHVFGGANRLKSEEDGLIVALSHDEFHENGKDSVHMNGTVKTWAHIAGELAWIAEYKLPFESIEDTIKRFQSRFGKNYL